MNIDHARIAILTKDKKNLSYFNENGDFKECAWNTGIMGEAIA